MQFSSYLRAVILIILLDIRLDCFGLDIDWPNLSDTARCVHFDPSMTQPINCNEPVKAGTSAWAAVDCDSRKVLSLYRYYTFFSWFECQG